MIHATAIIDPRAKLHPSVTVGPYAIIEGAAEIAAGCRIEAHAQIVGHVVMGENCRIGRAAILGGDPQDLSFDPATPSSVILGSGNDIREHVTIHRGSNPGSETRLGDGNMLMVGCHLGHDVILGNKNVIANDVLLAGHVHVGNQTFIGGGAVFHQFLRIGDACVIQGNGSFSKDIPHFCAAQRINRITGLNVIGLRRQGFDGEERKALKALFEILFNSGKNLSQAITVARQADWPDSAMRLLEFVEAPSKKGVCALRPGRVDD